MPFTPRRVTAGGRTFRYLEAAPDSPPRGTIVLVHAFPLNARMWAPQESLAARGWRVIAPQLRQFDDGRGEPPASSIDDYAADIVDMLGALGAAPAIVGGGSMGGYVAFAVFRRAPELVQALLLADTRPQADTPEGVEGRKAMIRLLRDRGVAAVAEEMLPKLLAAGTRAERPAVTAHVRELVLANQPEAVAGAIAALMTRPDSTALLDSIRCPAAVIVGAEDSVTPPAVAEAMHAALPGSQLTVIAAAGHLSNLERPDAFNRAFARFLDTIRTPAR